MEMFLTTMESLDSKTQTGFSGCIIEPHHRIDFFTDGERTSRDACCFKCSQVSWDGTTATRKSECIRVGAIGLGFGKGKLDGGV